MFVFWMCLLSAHFSPAHAGGKGGWSSGGGDAIRLRVLKGAALVQKTVQKLNFTHLENTKAPADVVLWILRNQTQLQKEFANLKLQWVSQPDALTCASTEYESGALIYLAFEKCGSIKTVDDATFLMAHEVAHHFGIRDEEYADRIATALLNVSRVFVEEITVCPEEFPALLSDEALEGNWAFSGGEYVTPRDYKTSDERWEHWLSAPKTVELKPNLNVARFFKSEGLCAKSVGQFAANYQYQGFGDSIKSMREQFYYVIYQVFGETRMFLYKYEIVRGEKVLKLARYHSLHFVENYRKPGTFELRLSVDDTPFMPTNPVTSFYFFEKF